MSIAQDLQEKYANEHRTPAPPFKPGELVLLKRVNVKTDRPSDKLDFKLLGPFKIIRAVGNSAFRLALPSTMHIHPTFHVSLLERYYPNTLPARQIAPPPDPIVADDGDKLWHVEKILKSRLFRRRLQFLIRWEGYDASEDQWISHDELMDDDPTVLEFYAKYPTSAINAAKRAAVQQHAFGLQNQMRRSSS
ncbi:FOG: Transposon-encoded proteins with TYA, reverse transcriptase, integrase domains in various combinations [Phaffia rhodozyma]|uniref:FOG: Transposon-encoded proteins with TYA, reverse transcriptase, integrase domains in various combinations n=1 Tax=Phaffia rhodozyma TaxID=264483 RepID=A0A0F7SXG5_PHARH|nr:FOG: Transposon-encoded proteins with TYA, reverse transcriptase, integrase domains in various combinations [Phaffia rhodozyma]